MPRRETISTKRLYSRRFICSREIEVKLSRSHQNNLSTYLSPRTELKPSSLPSLKLTHHTSSVTNSQSQFPASTQTSNTEQFVNSSVTSTSHTTRYLSQGTTSKMNRHIYAPIAFLFVLIALAVSTQTASADKELDQNLRKLNISLILNNIPSGVNTVNIDIKGNQAKPGAHIPVKNFNDVDLTRVKYNGDDSTQYTIMLLDLDRKVYPSNRSMIYNQYSSFNIPGNDVSRGQIFVPLEVPVVHCHPSSKHRILVLVFSQREALDVRTLLNIIPGVDNPKPRKEINLNQWMSEYHLNIHAINVFQAIGETGGVCSGSITLQSSNMFLVAMISTTIAFAMRKFDRL